jgi:DNA-binding XRE family transcriptional regulator
MREIPEDLRKTLRNRRAALHLGRDELAEKVGCSEKFIGLVERGERVPGPPLARKIAEVLELEGPTLALWDAATAWSAR